MRGSRLTRAALARIEGWVAREGVECLYLLADAADPVTAPLAEQAGFRLVDVRVTLDRPLRARDDSVSARISAGDHGGDAASAAAVAVRQARAADVPELRRIAAASHHDSRFYYDPHFDRGRCDELYSIWIENSCGDPDGVVLVAAPPPPLLPGADAGAGAGALHGYVTVGLAPGGEGRIGLFAVAAAAQGQGIGGRLIAAALDWLEGRGASTLRVVTQGRNVRAQRIYQQFGLRTRSLELWYHRWW